MKFFPPEIYCLVVSKNFVGNPLLFLQFGAPKKVRERGARQKRSSSDFVLSHSTETFGKANFQYVTNFWYRKTFCLRRKCHKVLANNFVSQYRKLSWRNPPAFHKVSGVENFFGQVGVERVSQFSFKLFVSQYRKVL